MSCIKRFAITVFVLQCIASQRKERSLFRSSYAGLEKADSDSLRKVEDL